MDEYTVKDHIHLLYLLQEHSSKLTKVINTLDKEEKLSFLYEAIEMIDDWIDEPEVEYSAMAHETDLSVHSQRFPYN